MENRVQWDNQLLNEDTETFKMCHKVPRASSCQIEMHQNNGVSVLELEEIQELEKKGDPC